MASVLVAAQTPARAANKLVFTAADADGNHFANSGKEIVHITNGAGGALALTIVTPGFIDTDLDIQDRVISIPAGETHHLGPWGEGEYNDGDNLVHMTYDSETSITIAITSPS